ncbi:MAG: DUF4173 domain-containing protein, partial [Bradyrhizobium sp.]|nr:DUF4173 domain-containing protein [Bradyrhizobium sp.]
QIAMTAIFVAGLLALIEAVNALSVTVAVLTTALFVIVVTAREASSWPWRLLEAATIPLRGPFQLVADFFKAWQSMKGRRVPHWLGLASLVAWIIPLAACAVFLGLFASANPLIEYRLTQINPNALLGLLDPSRMLFWIFVVGAIWPLIVRRFRWNGQHREPGPLLVSAPSDPGHLLGVRAMTRSLILFNALFALQSGLDLVYLWGGATLPGGMSHAEYAHRGAYPLIATALLAAAFVLIAMRAGGPAEQSRLIRPLVLAWIGQNILLVISSIFRLDLYVAAFSLTYLRLAAFIWMLLVATGLLLILIQIIRGKPLSWLVAANAASLALVLYGCCFINAPRLVAAYNVSHSREAGGTGPWLDKEYLRSLGPEVLPVLEPRLPQIPSLQSTVSQLRSGPNTCESRRRRSENWRAMDFRTWRLQRYLANNPDMATNSPDSGKG